MRFVEANFLNHKDRVIREESYPRLIDYLEKYHPKGFSEACDITIDGKEVLNVDNYDIELKEGQLIVLLFRPAGPVVGPILIQMVIAAAVSYVIGQIFAPEMPQLQQTNSSRNSKGKSSSVYSLNAQQNEAKAGEVVPIIYGRVRAYPALIAPPYYRYENNEEYLYQLMCIGQGKYDIEDILIGDTSYRDLQSDNFSFKKLEYDDFSPIGGIKSTVADDGYQELVKVIKDVENLELKGTPGNKNMYMRFDGTANTITFFPYLDGTAVDLSAIANGTEIKINGTISNNKTFTATGSAVGNVVTVAEVVTTEPNDIINLGPRVTVHNEEALVMGGSGFTATNEVRALQWDWDGDSWLSDYWRGEKPPIGSYMTFTNAGTGSTVFRALSTTYSSYFFDNDLSPLLIDDGNTPMYANFVAKEYQAEFDTDYGNFRIRKANEGVQAFEIDYVFPNGLYNTDASGNFTDRTVRFEVSIRRLGTDGLYIFPFEISTTGRTNSPIRKTYRAFVLAEPESGLYMRLRRLDSEPENTNSYDKLYIRSIKRIYEEKDYAPLGDVSLLWCKVKATNAISSIGQFSVNTFIERNDVDNTLDSVLSDIYSNTVYGGRLPATDLVMSNIDTSERGEYVLDPLTATRTTADIGILVNGEDVVSVYYNGVLVYQDFSSTLQAGVPFIGTDGNKYDLEFIPVNHGAWSPVAKYVFGRVHGAIDTKMTLFDSLQMIAKSNRYSLYPTGAQLKLRYDGPRALRTALFNETNILKDSLRISYLFEEQDTTDSIKVRYRDPTDFSEQEALYPIEGLFPKELELWGCTDAAKAEATAKYLFKQDRARRKTVEFKTDVQGLIPEFLDRIGVSHRLPNWGFSSEVASITAITDFYEVILQDKIDIMYNKIIFRFDNGSASDILSFTRVDDFTLRIAATDMPSGVHGYTDREATKCSVGTASDIVKDYTVISVKPNGNEVTITASNYDEGIYL